ncbi:hypothetical protein [Falsibacillus albus]|uniref:hypothetical protein n=1 Tax=Falsibacillus albus TaxID=2478915 RepID=UPI001F304FC3|nr:hypothetical protein [Falsibacillus albus]
MKGRKVNYWSAILWVPYFILFVYLIATTLPITDQGDKPNPATGLILIGALMAYPLYIQLINYIGYPSEDQAREI